MGVDGVPGVPCQQNGNAPREQRRWQRRFENVGAQEDRQGKAAVISEQCWHFRKHGPCGAHVKSPSSLLQPWAEGCGEEGHDLDLRPHTSQSTSVVRIHHVRIEERLGATIPICLLPDHATALRSVHHTDDTAESRCTNAYCRLEVYTWVPVNGHQPIRRYHQLEYIGVRKVKGSGVILKILRDGLIS
jgi:hypothetical protein